MPATKSGANLRSRKPVLCSVLKSYGTTTYRARGKGLFCLSLDGRFLRDHTDLMINDASLLLTDDPNESLRFIDQEVAIARALALKENGINVDIKLELFPYL